MSSPPTDSTGGAVESNLALRALEHLRKGVNPFATQVAAVGTAAESLLGDVREFAGGQLTELLEIVGTYRTGHPPTRAFAVLGERGAGKTHLLYALRDDLKRQAGERGDETLLVVVDRLAPGMDAIDYLLWQVVNHFLAHKGEGGRMLGVIAARLAARLLRESLRQLAPHQKAELVPGGGFWSVLGLGGSAKTQARLDAVDRVIQRCEAKHPSAAQLRHALQEAGVKAEIAVGVIERHLDRTESKDVAGWLREELYARLARVALLDDRGAFEEFHTGGFEDAPANVKNAGNLGRRLLEVWLDLLAVLAVPVVVVFDQLEDYVTAPDPEQEKANRKFFTDSTAKFVNELPGVCLLIFANETFWVGLLNYAEPFARERLTQPFTLPGRPARHHLTMPDRVAPALVEKLVTRRLLVRFPDLDLTGLPPAFPFYPADVEGFSNERTIRQCLRAMARRYDEILYPKRPDRTTATATPADLKTRLKALWRDKLAASERLCETERSVGAAFIPEVQNAIDGWLQCLHRMGLTGSGPWHKVDLVTDTKKGQYGYLGVIRTDGRNAPGIGVAAWLGQSKGQPYDLKQRVGFFKANPCPIKTLVMLRADGESALKGPQTKEAYEGAIAAKRDVRIQPYEPRHLHALMAFTPWYQAAAPEVQSAKEAGVDGDAALREFLSELSKELLGWIDNWRQPRVTPAAAPAKGAKV